MNSDRTAWVSPKMKQIAWKLINMGQNDHFGGGLGILLVLGR